MLMYIIMKSFIFSIQFFGFVFPFLLALYYDYETETKLILRLFPVVNVPKYQSQSSNTNKINAI